MEKLARRWAQKIGDSQNAESEKVAVIAYGLTALLQLVCIFFSTVLLGCLFDFFWEAMIVFFSVGFLRRLIGGVHSGSFNGCLFLSVFCIALFSALARYVLPLTGFWTACLVSGAIYLVASLLIYRLAPVDSPNKPVRRPEKIKRLRRSAAAVMAAFIWLTAIMLLMACRGTDCLTYLWALDLSVLWQVCMLTSGGKRLIETLDHLFKVPQS